MLHRTHPPARIQTDRLVSLRAGEPAPRRAARLVAYSMTVALIGCAPARPAEADTARVDALESERLAASMRAADRLLDNLHAVATPPGLSAAVASDGNVVWSAGRGWADVEDSLPVTPDSRFRLASVSKLFTATLALRLVESGQLDLDANVQRYVPGWPEHGGEPITIRHLASHTSGINHYASLASSAYVEGEHYPDILGTLEFFADAPLLNRPGEAYSYSSFGYALLNAVTQGASGLTLSDGLETLIFNPARLTHTSLEDVRSLPPGAVTLYRTDDTGGWTRLEPNDQSFVWGATGMRSTPSDLVRFGAAFLSGELVSLETRDRALIPTSLDDGSPAGEERYDVGFGWRVGQDWDGRRVAHHAGLTPGARTILLGYPDDGAVVALVLNATWTSRMETTAELLAAPFMREGADSEACPVGDWAYDGTLEEESERGRIVIAIEEGVCVGTLRSDGALAERWSEDAPAEPREFPLVRVARRADGHVFAIAYPWGLAQLTVSDTSEGFRARGDIVGWPLVLRAEGH